MSGHKGMVHYRVEVKREAVRLVQEGHHSYAQVAVELGIRKAARIKVWVRMYRREGEASFHHKSSGRPRKNETAQHELERLRMENALLKKFHTELRTRRLAPRNIGRSTTTGKSTP